MSPDAPFDLATFIALARRVGTDTATVEVKTAREKLPKDIAETVSAFANASGGTIVCGISEQDGFVPAEGFDAKSAMDSLSNVCHEKVEPPPFVLRWTWRNSRARLWWWPRFPRRSHTANRAT